MPLTTEEKTAVGRAIGAEDKRVYGHIQSVNGQVEVQFTQDGALIEGSQRLTIRVDTETLNLYRVPPSGKRSSTRLKGAVVLQYVERPAQTPSGGRYTARRMTIRTADGSRWVGTMRKDSDIVRFRPESSK